MLRSEVAGPVSTPVMNIEPLEKRTHLSAVSLVNGALRVHGTKHADSVIVSKGLNNTLELNLDGQTHTYNIAKVKRIHMLMGRGNDNVVFMQNRGDITIGAVIMGGKGNDTLVGGAGNDVIVGAQGDDHIGGGAGNNELVGGAGLDLIEGVKENTSLARELESGTAKPQAITLPPSYTITDLGTVANGLGSRIPHNINNVGSVVGDADVSRDGGFTFMKHAMYRSSTSRRFIDLQTLAGTNVAGVDSIAWDVNTPTGGADELVVGQSEVDPTSFKHAFVWDRTNGLFDIGELANGETADTIAYGVNDFGEVVGTSNNEVFYWHVATGIRRPRPNQRIIRGVGREINNDAIVAGQLASNNHAFLYRFAAVPLPFNPDIITDLGVLPGTTTSIALDLNNLPFATLTAVGTSGNKAFAWQAGRMAELPTPPNITQSSQALGVNDSADIVGSFTRVQTGETHATLWRNRALIDLTTIDPLFTQGRRLEIAHAINNSGQIVASGITFPGETIKHTFLLTPGQPVQATGKNIVDFSSKMTKSFAAPPNLDRVVYQINGFGNFRVTQDEVEMNLVTQQIRRGVLPSEGIVDFFFPQPFERYKINNTTGTAKFRGTGFAFVTLQDGTIGDFTISVVGRTFRKNKVDKIEGKFYAISQRGKIIQQGASPIFDGKFQMKTGSNPVG